MKIGLYLRNMGPQSTRGLIADAARAAEEAGIDDLWVADHLALAPEDSEGSDGRYLEPLATLAFLAGITERVGLAVGVLIVPYRPALLSAKWVASIQELSGGRLILGVGVGWMDKEFRALGVDPRRRGALTDAALAFLHECFERDEVEANGQRFLFRPRPARPPIIVGGAPPHAIRRAVRFGDGWMPTAMHADVLESGIADLRAGMAAAGKPAPEVVLLQSLPVDDDERLVRPPRRARRPRRHPRRPSLALPGRRGGGPRRGAPRRRPRCPRVVRLTRRQPCPRLRSAQGVWRIRRRVELAQPVSRDIEPGGQEVEIRALGSGVRVHRDPGREVHLLRRFPILDLAHDLVDRARVVQLALEHRTLVRAGAGLQELARDLLAFLRRDLAVGIGSCDHRPDQQQRARIVERCGLGRGRRLATLLQDVADTVAKRPALPRRRASACAARRQSCRRRRAVPAVPAPAVPGLLFWYSWKAL